MTREEALMLTSGLSTFFDRRPWTAEKIRFFAQAIEDLDYEAAKEAVQRYMKDGEYAPVPRDIREIARTIEPKRKLLPGRLDADGWPIRYHREDDTTSFRCTPQERRDLDRTYARMRAETNKAVAEQKARRGAVGNNVRSELTAAIERLMNKGDEPPF